MTRNKPPPITRRDLILFRLTVIWTNKPTFLFGFSKIKNISEKSEKIFYNYTLYMNLSLDEIINQL